ncbi:hypothetical protein J2T56_002255 [Natronobacillus azotifigens]|uniref:YqzL family protein n=1 Tax=Natronobacillus azotifigens TaxID=472978 RepID=A0A9J6REQ5_9BACI|nr:YqzL family protein [Natronobacillus azotifigens]
MVDLPWKFFSQTGNVETYLLMKELESVDEEEVSMIPANITDFIDQQT